MVKKCNIKEMILKNIYSLIYGIFGSYYGFEIICSEELKEKIEQYG